MKAYPMVLSKEQADAILREAEKKDEFDYMFFLTLRYTGRRIGELYGIQEQEVTGRVPTGRTRTVYIKGKAYEVDITREIYKRVHNEYKYGVRVRDIDFGKGTMKVVILKTKKKVPGWSEINLTPLLQRVLYAYIQKNKLRPDDRVFRRKGKGIRQIQHLIKKYAKLAGVPTKIKQEGIVYTLSPHSFRHTLISELKRQGWEDAKIIKFTGHKSANTLRNYDHTTAIDFKEDYLDAMTKL